MFEFTGDLSLYEWSRLIRLALQVDNPPLYPFGDPIKIGPYTKKPGGRVIAAVVGDRYAVIEMDDQGKHTSVYQLSPESTVNYDGWILCLEIEYLKQATRVLQSQLKAEIAKADAYLESL